MLPKSAVIKVRMVILMIRRTKIMATLGPATDRSGTLEQMIRAGVDLVRVNFSHGHFQEHRERIQAVRACAARLNRQVGILIDLQGPKIRIAQFEDGYVQLHRKQPSASIRNCRNQTGHCHRLEPTTQTSPGMFAQVTFCCSMVDVLCCGLKT